MRGQGLCTENNSWKVLEKDRKLPAAFMTLGKAYDRVNSRGLWDVPRIYGVEGRLFEGIKSIYKDASASVRVDGEQSASLAMVRV